MTNSVMNLYGTLIYTVKFIRFNSDDLLINNMALFVCVLPILRDSGLKRPISNGVD